MMKHIAYVALLALTLSVASCGNGSRKEFNKLLLELADADQTIDGNDWQKIADFLDRNKAHFKEFYDHGQIDVDDVEDYISDFFEHRRPSKHIAFQGIGAKQPTFHIYVERSGSMTPYDSRDGDGSFRAAIMALQNNLPGTATIDSVGEKGYTNFQQIFDQILNRTNEDQVSVLVTDLIYSVKDMQGVNPQRVFSEIEGMTNAVFKSEVKNKSMLVVRMMGSYNGPYYSYDNSVKPFAGRRPYYIIIVASNTNMVRLTHDATLRTFADMERMRGYDNMCLMTANDIYKPYYSFLLSNRDVRGRFRPKRGQDTQIRSLTGVEPDRNSGDIQLALAVDLSHLFIDQRYLTDVSNYEVKADDDVRIKEIRKIEKADMTPAEKKYLGTATHIFVLQAASIGHGQEVEIKLLNRMPQWIGAASTDNDLTPDANTTFGLKYLLGGIYDSYNRNADDHYYFELELELDR